MARRSLPCRPGRRCGAPAAGVDRWGVPYAQLDQASGVLHPNCVSDAFWSVRTTRKTTDAGFRLVLPQGFRPTTNIEQRRLDEDREGKAPWKKWGPYLSERHWGTVREDYSYRGTKTRSLGVRQPDLGFGGLWLRRKTGRERQDRPSRVRIVSICRFLDSSKPRRQKY